MDRIEQDDQDGEEFGVARVFGGGGGVRDEVAKWNFAGWVRDGVQLRHEGRRGREGSVGARGRERRWGDGAMGRWGDGAMGR